MAPPAPPSFTALPAPTMVDTSTVVIQCASARDLYVAANKALALAERNAILLHAEQARTSSLTRALREVAIAPSAPEPDERVPGWLWGALVAIAAAAFGAGVAAH